MEDDEGRQHEEEHGGQRVAGPQLESQVLPCERSDVALPVYGELEIGWRIAEVHWGTGIAREAAAASLGWAWANRPEPRVAAWTSPGNQRSWGLMRRLGMARAPELDFHHPRYAAGDPDGTMIVHTIARPT